MLWGKKGGWKLPLFLTPVPSPCTCRLIWDVVCIWCVSLIKIRGESLALSGSTRPSIGQGGGVGACVCVCVRIAWTGVTGIKLVRRATATPDRVRQSVWCFSRSLQVQFGTQEFHIKEQMTCGRRCRESSRSSWLLRSSISYFYVAAVISVFFAADLHLL